MNPDFLGLLAYGSAAAQAVMHAARPAPAAWWQRRWLFALLLAAALLVFQRDAIRANFQIWNPDESQLIAGALVLPERPVFWREVDGTTHGPLAQYPLLLPAALGARLDYTSARLVSAGIVVLLLLTLHAALATWLAEGTARLVILPGWTWLIFNQDPEIAQYTTGLMPSLLVALAAWPALRLLASGATSPAWCALAGAAAGAVPFAKLQAVPLALWIFGFMLAALGRSGAPDRSRWIAACLVGALVPAILLLGPTVAGGALTDFRIRYLEVNLLGYVAGGSAWFNRAVPRPDMLFGFGHFLWPVLAAVTGAAAWLALRRERPSWTIVVFTAGLVLAAAFAIWAPRKPFAHYFLLLAGPLLLLLGAVTGPLFRQLAGAAPRWRAAGVLLLTLGLAGPSVLHHFQHPAYFRSIVPTRPPLDRELIAAVQRHTIPGGGLAVWGWQPGLYVFTQTLSATPDLIVFWQIVPSPWRDFYRDSYLRDLAARPPPVFVDTTGPADFFFFRHPDARHEEFPALREFIAQEYTLAETVAGARIFLRRNRAGPSAPAL